MDELRGGPGEYTLLLEVFVDLDQSLRCTLGLSLIEVRLLLLSGLCSLIFIELTGL